MKNKIKIKKNKKKIQKKNPHVKQRDNHNSSYVFQGGNINGRLIEKWNKKSSEETEAVLAILRLKSEKKEYFEPITLMVNNEIQQLDTSSSNVPYIKLVKQK
eukprot:Anaeramoba_flamelloidesa307_22.p1 GENE.a307_22~~a307_22.p1  ORF type:complete len:102 (-),score=26.35 a307_22:106-411(-)